jgi:phosphate transport system permease protein
MTPPPNTTGGGLANAIVGSLLLVALARSSARRSASWPASISPNTARRTAREHDPLHQRHPAVGAVDRDRPVRLCDRRRPSGHFSGWAGVIALALIRFRS